MVAARAAEPGLVSVLDKLIEEATKTRDYVAWAVEATPEEIAEAREADRQRKQAEADADKRKAARQREAA